MRLIQSNKHLEMDWNFLFLDCRSWQNLLNITNLRCIFCFFDGIGLALSSSNKCNSFLFLNSASHLHISQVEPLKSTVCKSCSSKKSDNKWRFIVWNIQKKYKYSNKGPLLHPKGSLITCYDSIDSWSTDII